MPEEFYFVVVNKLGTSDPEWFHYFSVVAKSPHVPESAGWQGKNVVGFATSPEAHASLQRTFTNKAMENWLSAGRSWPVIKGWHR